MLLRQLSLACLLCVAAAGAVCAQDARFPDAQDDNNRRAGNYGGRNQRRLEDLATELAREAATLSEQAYRNYSGGVSDNGGYNNAAIRSDVESVFLAEQFNGGAELFLRMIRDRRSNTELTEGYSILRGLAQRADSNPSQRNLWNNSARLLAEIDRQLNSRGGGIGGGRDGGAIGGGRNRDNPDDYDTNPTGRFRWRGTVDDYVRLTIRGNNVEPRTIGGNEYNNSTFNFTTALPRRVVRLNLNKIRGRGDISIIQYPSRDNDWTAIVDIRDPRGGASDYEFELNW